MSNAFGALAGCSISRVMRPSTWVRAGGTLFTACAILLPLMIQGSAGVVETVRSIGVVAALSLVGGFCVAVALYCISLQRCLGLIAPNQRCLRPRQVWLMFVPFYNITEDFFIVHALTQSLKNEASAGGRLRAERNFGGASGYGWCVAQVLALIPTPLGQAASVAALALWITHWLTIRRLSQQLCA